MRPDEETNNAFLYCLIVAAIRYKIDILNTLAEANHHHTTIFDREGNCPAFVEYFHKLFARCQNALRGRWENFWAAGEPCITRLLDRETVINKLVYGATNPVKDHLVDRVHHWPGANSYPNLLSGRPLTARRPRHFFRPDGPMPESVTLELTIPPELGPAAQVIAEVKAGVDAVERAVAEQRRRNGTRIMGRKAVLAQSWKTAPTSTEPRRNLRPRFAGGAKSMATALQGYGMFLDAYRAARTRWSNRCSAIFPPGTYWLARFAGVPVEAAA